jgi:hypothetical protein
MPEIPATWEAEAGGSEFEVRQGKVGLMSCLKNNVQPGLVAHDCKLLGRQRSGG